jgi:ABC-type transporter Mla maintaining outer membrane lipid asymmetry permease subunit MlaE
VRGGPEQVGRATTSAVVVSIVLVIVVDLAMTAILYVR